MSVNELDNIVMNVASGGGGVDVLGSALHGGGSLPAVAEENKKHKDSIAVEEGKEKPSFFIMPPVDLEFIYHFSFEKKFYTPVDEIQKMTPSDVAAYRKDIQIEIIGTDAHLFNPIKTWAHIGLPKRLTYPIVELQYKEPRPIQAQVLPVAMSGRDCIVLANKGSGKTLAYVLPILRHMMQPTFDALVGLIIAPDRFLADSIYCILKRFTNTMPICWLAPVFSGDAIKLVPKMKAGHGIVVCTPESGYAASRFIHYTRVTFVVIDDADVIVDMGLEQKVLATIQDTRFDRQTLVFSTTSQPAVKNFARTVTLKPVEIHELEKLDGGETSGSEEARGAV